jgi:protocatechuate 3,4-dioxygenase beta subunit
VGEPQVSRRRLLELGAALPPLAALGSGAGPIGGVARAAAAPLALTPAALDADDDPTPAQTEGPYFTPNSPLRDSLVPTGAPGTRLTLSGRVLSTSGTPINRALLDFWQADAGGVYDTSGFRFRGHLFTDARGRYGLLTVVPGLYTGRTRHIHVKAQAPGQPVLTTQLYFPGEARNRTDGIFDANLLLRGWRRVGRRHVARFDFVLETA